MSYLTLEPAPGIPHAAASWRLGNVYEHMGRCAEARTRYTAAAEAGYAPARAALEEFDCAPGSRPAD